MTKKPIIYHIYNYETLINLLRNTGHKENEDNIYIIPRIIRCFLDIYVLHKGLQSIINRLMYFKVMEKVEDLDFNNCRRDNRYRLKNKEGEKCFPFNRKVSQEDAFEEYKKAYQNYLMQKVTQKGLTKNMIRDAKKQFMKLFKDIRFNGNDTNLSGVTDKNVILRLFGTSSYDYHYDYDRTRNNPIFDIVFENIQNGKLPHMEKLFNDLMNENAEEYQRLKKYFYMESEETNEKISDDNGSFKPLINEMFEKHYVSADKNIMCKIKN